MPILAVDIHDAGIRAARSDGGTLLAVDGGSTWSPGVAIASNGSIITGAEAARRACFSPSAVRDRFWHRLNTDPLDSRDRRLGNQAELACAHLRMVWKTVLGRDDEAVFVVPASYTPTQLGVVVALARELEIPLSGLVPRPLAFGASDGPGRGFLFVDIGLHVSVLSVVGAVDGDTGEACLAMGESHLCPEVGVGAFRRRWVKAIGGEFLRTTRFDPLHDAETEQQLYEIVQAMADAVGPIDAVPLELRAGGRSHQIMVTQRLLADATQDLIRALASSVRAAAASASISEIVIGGGSGRVPGLDGALGHQTAKPIRWLDPGATVLDAVRLWPEAFERAGEPGVGFCTWRRVGSTLERGAGA